MLVIHLTFVLALNGDDCGKIIILNKQISQIHETYQAYKPLINNFHLTYQKTTFSDNSYGQC